MFSTLTKLFKRSMPVDLVLDARGKEYFHYIESSYLNQLFESNQQMPGNNLGYKVYLVECVVDDCGWGTVDKEMNEFHETSFWTYLIGGNIKNVKRKIRVNLWCPITRFFGGIKYGILYRFHPQHKYHLINTGLEYGYYEVDYRILHGCFNLLKEFVEVELARAQYYLGEKKQLPRWKSKRKYIRKNKKELGLKYLSYWENIKPDKNGSREGLSPKEWISARAKDRAIKELYLWWVEQRPNRKSPYDKPRDKISWKTAWEVTEEYEKEDEKMLMKLIKIRNRLWT